ncbi:HTH-type transcriptional regulator ImmR [compost metagenome]
MSTLGERIKHLRELKGLSQKDLSEKTQLTIVQLSRYETNHRKPDPDALSRLVTVLETSADYLIGLNSEPLKSSARELNAKFSFYMSHPVYGVFLKEFLNAPDQLRNETKHFFEFITHNYEGLELKQDQTQEDIRKNPIRWGTH